MIVTIASGKGGTGKTTVATSLALSLAAEITPPPLFLDCDVEAPNAHLFLQPVIERQEEVAVSAPKYASTMRLLCWVERHWSFLSFVMVAEAAPRCARNMPFPSGLTGWAY